MTQFQRNKYKEILRQDFLDYINRTFWITKKADVFGVTSINITPISILKCNLNPVLFLRKFTIYTSKSIFRRL